MSVIQGSENIFHIKREGGGFLRVGFLTVNSHSNNTTFLNTTTRENAGFKTEIPIEISSTISFSAVIFEDADLVGKVGYKDLLNIQNTFERFQWKLEVLNKNFTRSGLGYIQNLSEESPVEGAITFSGEINVYGRYIELEDDQSPTTPVLSLDSVAGTPSVLLNWTASTDNLAVDYYEIRKFAGSLPEERINVGNVTEYEDLSISYFTYYSYNVRAVDVSGNPSAWSNKRLAFISVPSGQPTPDYKEYQSGVVKTYQDGTPKVLQ